MRQDIPYPQRSRVAGLEQSLQNVGDAKSVLDITESVSIL